MKALKVYKVGDRSKNALNYWWKFKNPLVVSANFIIIELTKILPSLALKRFLLGCIGMKVGRNAAIGLGAQFDIFFPEMTELGDNCIIGYGATILCHEFLIDELRTGRVRIGKNAMIGANTTVLPGVSIGDEAIVSACSLVNKDVRPRAFVGGVPAKILKKRR